MKYPVLSGFGMSHILHNFKLSLCFFGSVTLDNWILFHLQDNHQILVTEKTFYFTTVLQNTISSSIIHSWSAIKARFNIIIECLCNYPSQNPVFRFIEGQLCTSIELPLKFLTDWIFFKLLTYKVYAAQAWRI